MNHETILKAIAMLAVTMSMTGCGKAPPEEVEGSWICHMPFGGDLQLNIERGKVIMEEPESGKVTSVNFIDYEEFDRKRSKTFKFKTEDNKGFSIYVRKNKIGKEIEFDGVLNCKKES